SSQRIFPLERTTSPVVVVVIDEDALRKYGQWPWPRMRLAELFDRIWEQHPAASGVDLIFPEPARFSPSTIAPELSVLPPEIRRALELLPSNDERFAQAIRSR